jgi:hypothetical protein
MKLILPTRLLLAIAPALGFASASLAQTESPIVQNGSQILQTESKEQSDWRFGSEEENPRFTESELDFNSTYNLNEEDAELSTLESEEKWENKGDRDDFTFTVPVEEF